MERNPELRELIAASGVKSEEAQRWVAYMRGEYRKLARDLPDDSAWKTGKTDHVLHAAEEVREHAANFGLEGVEEDVLAFLVSSHDVGRLADEARRVRGIQCLWRHGKDSAHVVREALSIAAGTESPLWQAMLLAIEHHSDVTTPSVEMLGGSKAAHALTALLRDFDKLAGFDDAERYVSDEDFKRKQITSNWRVQRMQDSTWGEEKERILPASMLERFVSGLALIRGECQSYEAYMLQYIAWLYDVQTPEVLRLIVARGGPKTVLRYVLSQLYEKSPEQYGELRAWAEKWEGGLLVAD